MAGIAGGIARGAGMLSLVSGGAHVGLVKILVTASRARAELVERSGNPGGATATVSVPAPKLLRMADHHARYLILNADAFGLSAGVNRGIIEAHERGIVTSASVMVRWPAAEEATHYGRANPQLSLGLHVDLGEWAYRDGTWVAM